MSEDSEDLAFLNHVISRDQNISCKSLHFYKMDAEEKKNELRLSAGFIVNQELT